MREPDVRCQWTPCLEQATASAPAGTPLCAECSRRFEPRFLAPLLRDPRIACLVVAAITGAVPHAHAVWATVQVLLRAAFAGDAAAVPIALDLIEEAGLHEPEAWPTVADVEWPRVVHEHRWFPVAFDRQCTCGLFEHEWRAGVDADGRAQRLRARLGSALHGVPEHRAEAILDSAIAAAEYCFDAFQLPLVESSEFYDIATSNAMMRVGMDLMWDETTMQQLRQMNEAAQRRLARIRRIAQLNDDLAEGRIRLPPGAWEAAQQEEDAPQDDRVDALRHALSAWRDT